MRTMNLNFKTNGIKMFSVVIILLTMFFSKPVVAADHIKSGDVLYVWAKTGLNLRQEPNIYAKRLTILIAGTEVKVLGFTQKAFAIETLPATEEEENPFVLKGNWILVDVGGIQGFVLDTYLLPIKAPEFGQTMKHYLISISEQVTDIGNAETDEYTMNAQAESGISIQYESGAYFRNVNIEIPNFTIEDGFVFYNFFMDIQTQAKAENSDIFLFKNWKEELSIFSDFNEVSFEIIDDNLVISESVYDGC